MTSKEKILGNIRTALQNSGSQKLIRPDFSKDIYLPTEELVEVTFAENFQKHKGDFFYCEDLETFLADLQVYLQKKNLTPPLVCEDYPQQLLQFARIDFQPSYSESTPPEASLSLCELLIARTGSLLVSSHQKNILNLSIQPRIHIFLAFTSQLVYHLQEGLEIILQRYTNNLPSQLSLITGPSISRVFDKSWTNGAFGPQELVLFLVDDILENHPNSDE